MSTVITTTTTTLSPLGSTTINVLSSAGMMVGSQISGSGIAVGAKITGILNGTITLSAPNSGGVTSGATITVTDPGGTIGAGVGNVVSAGTATNEYNTIQQIVSQILGAPQNSTPQLGYNQSVISTQVTNSGGASNSLNLITVNQWANLRTDLIKARGHQTGSPTEANSLAIPTNALLVTDAFRSNYLAYAQVIAANTAVVGPGQYTIESVSTAVRTAIWNGNISSVITIVFGDLPTARAYFNAGGLLLLTMTLTGTFSTTSQLKDTTWATMMSQIGTITFGSNSTTIGVGSTATSVANSIGYFQLSTNNQLILEKDAPSGAYSANRLYVYARLSDLTSGTMIITVNYDDLSGQPNPPWGTDEYVDGTLSQYLVAQRPTGSYVSIPALSVSVTGDLTPTTGSVYGLRSSSYSVNEGGSFTITLTTQGVADNTLVPYTITGVSSSRIQGNLSGGTFTVVGNAATASFTILNNLFTDGPTTFTLTLANGLASVNVAINDTSTTPKGQQIFTSNGTFTTGAGTTTFNVMIVGGGGGGGSNGGGGGAAGQLVITNFTSQIPGSSYNVTIGAGGSPGQPGGTTTFQAFSALGGNAGASGGISGYAGGSGGSTPGRYSGGSGTATNQGLLYRWAGGGGAGYTGSGSNGTLDGSNIPDGGAGGPGGITFNNTTYFIGGGGGGGTTSGVFGSAANGGGEGGGAGKVGTDGQANTGGGGGGGAGNSGVGYSGGSGGSGYVVVYWP